MAGPFLSVRALSHAFGGVRALVGVDLEVRAGEVHALCGENGAGKSTLNRVLSGALRPDEGEVLVDGLPMALGSVPAAEQRGIVLVTQEPSWFPDLDAVDNVHLMHEGGLWLDRAGMAAQTREALGQLGEAFSVEAPLEELSFAQRQMVSLARAASRKCRLLILDEPTASLSQRETDALFGVVRTLRDQGVAVLYVTHRLEEVFALADRVSVLRDGRHVATQAVGELDREALIRLMVGREVHPGFSLGTPDPQAEACAHVLEVSGLSRPGVFEDVSFEVRAGEIVALAGLVGAGRSEVARAVFGLDAATGKVRVGGEPLPLGDPAGSIRRGLAYVPEDRQHEGLHPPMSVAENVAMASLPRRWIDRSAERAVAERAAAATGVRADTVDAPVTSLSGGNQQKVLLAKWLETQPRVLILDEPTRGVDVGAKEEVHALIRGLAAEGVAVLVISSEMPEVLALADRVLVMREGRLAGELGGEATQESILELALPRGERVATTAAKRGVSRESGVALLLAATVIAATVANPSFLALENVRDMGVRVAPAAIVGCGLTLVVMAREIDISMGSLMGLCAAVMGIAASPDRLGLGVAAAVALCLGTGLVGGMVNGLLVAYGRVPSIIVTLGTLSVFRGVTELLMGGVWITDLPAGLRVFGTGSALGVPAILWVALAVAAAGIALTLRMPLGRRVLALGSNPGAAVRLGMPVRRVRLGVFALTGLLAGLAALFSATQLRVVESGFGAGFELMVVAAVVVGGTSIRGGRGSIAGTLLGATLLGIVGTVLIFLRLGDSAAYWDRAVQGAFILAAVVADSLSRRRAA